MKLKCGICGEYFENESAKGNIVIQQNDIDHKNYCMECACKASSDYWDKNIIEEKQNEEAK